MNKDDTVLFEEYKTKIVGKEEAEGKKECKMNICWDERLLTQHFIFNFTHIPAFKP